MKLLHMTSLEISHHEAGIEKSTGGILMLPAHPLMQSLIQPNSPLLTHILKKTLIGKSVIATFPMAYCLQEPREASQAECLKAGSPKKRLIFGGLELSHLWVISKTEIQTVFGESVNILTCPLIKRVSILNDQKSFIKYLHFLLV